jgi:hypothetical protein
MAKRPPRGTSALLINEPPLQVLPSLAVAVGLNEAIILQQMHFWLLRSTHVVDGIPWVYNTYEEWREQFPFWSAITIQRAILALEGVGVVESTTRFNRNPIDKSKWYTINHTRLNELTSPATHQNDMSTHQVDMSTHQPDTLDASDCYVDISNCYASQRLLPETSAEIPLPQTPPPAGEGPGAVAAEEGSADAPEEARAPLPHPWERPAFPPPRQPWDKPVPPAIAACGLCDDHGLVDLETPDGTPLTARCVHVAGAMEAFAQHHGYQLVHRDRSRDPPTPASPAEEQRGLVQEYRRLEPREPPPAEGGPGGERREP